MRCQNQHMIRQREHGVNVVGRSTETVDVHTDSVWRLLCGGRATIRTTGREQAHDANEAEIS